MCFYVFADRDKLTSSHTQPRIGFKSILTQPKLFVFLKQNPASNCALCLFIFTDNVYLHNIGTHGWRLREAPPQKKPCKFGHCPKRGGGSKRLPKLFVAVLQ